MDRFTKNTKATRNGCACAKWACSGGNSLRNTSYTQRNVPTVRIPVPQGRQLFRYRENPPAIVRAANKSWWNSSYWDTRHPSAARTDRFPELGHRHPCRHACGSHALGDWPHGIGRGRKHGENGTPPIRLPGSIVRIHTNKATKDETIIPVRDIMGLPHPTRRQAPAGEGIHACPREVRRA